MFDGGGRVRALFLLRFSLAALPSLSPCHPQHLLLLCAPSS